MVKIGGTETLREYPTVFGVDEKYVCAFNNGEHVIIKINDIKNIVLMSVDRFFMTGWKS